MRSKKKGPPPASPNPMPSERTNVIINHNAHERTPRFAEEEVLPALREAFSQRPEWRGFSPRQLSILLFLYGYSSRPPKETDVEAATPFALEDRAGAA